MSFNFTVAVVPNNIDINTELLYVKSALLYADEITLISPIAYLYTLITNDKNLKDERAAYDLVKLIAPFIKSSNEDLFSGLVDYMNTSSNILFGKNKSIPIKTKFRIRQILFQCVQDASSIIKENIGLSQCQEFNKLLVAGKIKLQPFDHMISDVDEVGPEYFRMLTEAIKCSYPIFDSISNDVMRTAVNARVVNLSEFDKKKIQHAGVSDNLLQKLPNFSDASIDEIIDIRNELSIPLVRFRSQMLKFSDDIQSCPWDKDFEFECIQLYAKEIAPAIQEIDELTKGASFIKNLARNSLVDSNLIKTASGLIVSIAAAGVFSAYSNVVSSGVAIGTATLAWTAEKVASTYLQMQDSNKEITKKDLYFYYQAGNLLKK